MTTPTPLLPPQPTIYPDYCHVLSPTISRWVPLRGVDVHSLQSVGLYVDGKEVYHFSNHPIKWVRLTGVLVAIDDFTERRVLTVDDSSGMCIECLCAVRPSPTSATATVVPGHLNQFQVRVTEPTKPASKTSTENNGKDTRGLGNVKEDGKRSEQPSTQNPQVPWEEIDIGSVLKIKGQITKFREMFQIEVIKIEVLRGTEQEVKCWDEVLAFRRDVLSKPWSVSAEEEEKCKRDMEKALRKAKSSKSHKADARTKKGDEVAKVGRGDESRVNRKDGEGEEESSRRHEGKKRRRDKEEGLDPTNKVNHPSMAVRRRVAGKYDALGI